MLGQVADVEFPQLAGRYKRTASYGEPDKGNKRITVVLTVPSYVFEDFRAKMTVRAQVFGPGRKPIFTRSYSAEGFSEYGKMSNAGAFGQKSAVRQSSLHAFKKVFKLMRPDILNALSAAGTAVP